MKRTYAIWLTGPDRKPVSRNTASIEGKASVTTIRKALTLLNGLGYAKTQNVKGTAVRMQNKDTVAKCMQVKVYRENTLRYLSGLQLTILHIKPAAHSAFSFIPPQALSKLKHADRIPLNCLTAFVLETLRTLLTEPDWMLC